MEDSKYRFLEMPEVFDKVAPYLVPQYAFLYEASSILCGLRAISRLASSISVQEAVYRLNVSLSASLMLKLSILIRRTLYGIGEKTTIPISGTGSISKHEF